MFQLLFAMGIVPFALLSVVALADRAPATEPATAEEAISPRDGVIRLFDGKTLGDCYTWLDDTGRDDPRKIFRVTKGMLHITGDGLGGIVTKKRYRDYHLVLEFKWGDRTWHARENAARDSGILVHSNGRDGGYHGRWMPAIEVQIIEGGVGDIVPVPGADERGQPVPIAYTSTVGRDRDGEVVWNDQGSPETFRGDNLPRVNWYGRDPAWEDRKDFRGQGDLDGPHGEWSRLDVLCDGGRIDVLVNGTKANGLSDVSPRAGRLQLQAELAEIYVRRWELWPLGAGPPPAPAAAE